MTNVFTVTFEQFNVSLYMCVCVYWSPCIFEVWQCAHTPSLRGTWGPGRGGPLLGQLSSRLQLVPHGPRRALGFDGADGLLGFVLFLGAGDGAVVLAALLVAAVLRHLLCQSQLCLQLQLPDILHGQTVPLVLPTPGLPMSAYHHLSQPWWEDIMILKVIASKLV